MRPREQSSNRPAFKSASPGREYNNNLMFPSPTENCSMRQLLSLAASAAVLLFTTVDVRADDQADAKALIEKAIKAAGGAENLAKNRAGTVQMKGKFYGQGDATDYTGSVTWQAPDNVRVEIEGTGFKFVQVLTKDKGWYALNGNTTELDKEQLAEAKEEQHADRVAELSPETLKMAKLELLGEMKVGDKPALGVRVEVKGYRGVSLFFDKETHLLVKSESRGKDVIGGGEEFTNEKLYSDYKKIGGVQVAHKVAIKRDSKKWVDSELTEYKVVEKIDASQFAKP
jgi:hypothetical protein